MIESTIPVIVNPAAGRGAGRRLIPRLERLAESLSLPIEILCTMGPGDAGERAATLASAGAPLIGVAGGDGTISEVAGSLVGLSTAIAIIPAGTGNDLARHLGLPIDPESTIHALRRFRIIKIDMGLANETPFIVAAGAGFDAAVAEAVNRGSGLMRGSAAFAIATIRTLWGYSPTQMQVEVDGIVEEFEGYFAVIANASGYGGGMKIAPGASLFDGHLDVCCVMAAPRLSFLAAAGRVYRGRHVTHPAVLMRRGRQISVFSDPPVPVTVDGEVIHRTPLHVKVVPSALRVALPGDLKQPA